MYDWWDNWYVCLLAHSVLKLLLNPNQPTNLRIIGTFFSLTYKNFTTLIFHLCELDCQSKFYLLQCVEIIFRIIDQNYHHESLLIVLLFCIHFFIYWEKCCATVLIRHCILRAYTLQLEELCRISLNQTCYGLPKLHRGWSNLSYIGDTHWANLNGLSAEQTVFGLLTPKVR